MSWAVAAGLWQRRLMSRYTPHHGPSSSHHRLPAASGAAAACSALRRRASLLALLVLVAVLVANMVLLVPHLHASGPSSGVHSSSTHGGWHLTGGASSGAEAPGADAAAGDAGATSTAAAAEASSSAASSGGGGSRQQQPGWASVPQPRGDFMAAFDANKDGVLGPPEFQTLLQEACRNERASLSLLPRMLRWLRLALGLAPRQANGAEAYPCSLTGELLDATSQAAAAIGRGLRGGSGGGPHASGDGSAAGRHSKRASSRGSIAGAETAAGAATVDPDSPEGQAAARRSELLSACRPLTPELAAAAASPGGSLLLVAADWGLFEMFGVNWLSHVQRSGLDGYLLAALDTKTADFLAANKLGRCITWAPGSSDGSGTLPAWAPPAASPGSCAHSAASWAALQAGAVLLGWEYDVLLTHLDVVWATDPGAFLTRLPRDAHVLLASSAPASAAAMASRDPALVSLPQSGAGGFSPGAALAASVSTGVVFLRAGAASRAALAAWLELHAAQLAAADALARSSATAAATAAAALLPPAAVVGAWLSGGGAARQVLTTPHPSQPNSLLLVCPRPGLLSRLLRGARCRARRATAVGVLSPVVVANAYSWFVQGVGSRALAVVARGSSGAAPGRKLPLAVHVGGQGASRQATLHMMRDASWYADGPRYYSEPQLLSFELQPYRNAAVTAGLANAPDYSQAAQLALHVASLEHQLSQFYAAAALAVSLGRVLLLPTFQCYCWRLPGGPPPLVAARDTGWSCRAPGDDSSVFPFNCTLDQVLDPVVLYSHAPVVGGRPLDFREAPFLLNPRTPSWVRHAATAVTAGTPTGCPDPATPCAQVLPGRPPPGVNQQVVVSRLTDAALGTALAPFASAKWLALGDVGALWGGFANPAHKAEFEGWLARVVRPWCCKPPGGGGDALSGAGDALPALLTELPTGVPGWLSVGVRTQAPLPSRRVE